MDLLNSHNFKVAITQLMQCTTGLKLYYVTAYQNLDE